MTDQAPPPAMTPQPYPLYAAVLTTNGDINYGRVIGWIDNRSDGDDDDRAHDWLPVVAYQDDSDGGIYHTAAVTDGADLYLSENMDRAITRAEARKTRRPKTASPLTAADLRRVWPEVAGRITKTNRRIGTLVRDTTVTAFDGTTVNLTARSPFLARMLDADAKLVREALYEELGCLWEIRVEAREQKDPNR
jgi:hypothetical protein